MKIKGLFLAFMAHLCCLTAMALEVEIDGLWYDLDSSTKEAKVIQYKNSIKYSGDVVIPLTVIRQGVEYNVTGIKERAFHSCSGLTSVTIPSSIVSIGEAAFQSCTSLTSVTIPNSVISIEYSAFYACRGLTSVIIPNSVTNIGIDAFKSCI